MKCTVGDGEYEFLGLVFTDEGDVQGVLKSEGCGLMLSLCHPSKITLIKEEKA